MLLFEWTSRIETVGFKLAEGKGLRAGWDSKELWNSVEKPKSPRCKTGIRGTGLTVYSCNGSGKLHT